MKTKSILKSSFLRIFKLAGLLVMLMSLSGCITAIVTANCIDAKTKREPIERNYLFSIENIQTGETETRRITCLGVYFAQCSARGNYWKWKQKEVQPYKISLGSNEEVYMRFPSCRSFEKRDIDKKVSKIWLEDGRYLSLKSVWGKADGWLARRDYIVFRDPDNEYIYYMSEDEKKKPRKRMPWPTTEEGKYAYYMNKNKEDSKRIPYIIPLNFSYKEIKRSTPFNKKYLQK